jgi:hypothetical protein
MRAITGSARPSCAAVLVALLATAVLGTGTASASHEPYSFVNRCPVDHPLFTQPAAGPETANSICVTSNSSHGTFRLGDRRVTTGSSNLQFGVHFDENVMEPGETVAFGGSLVAEPSYPPGGLLGIRLPDSPPSNPLQGIKNLINKGVFEGPAAVLGVRTRVLLAGQPSDFNLSAAASPNSGPVLNLPVMIRLEHPVLGRKCLIGSRANPIVLQPETDVAGDLTFIQDPLAPEIFAVRTTGGAQSDDAFAVPRARNCGPFGVLDPIVNEQLGLPLPEGGAEIRLLDASATLLGDNVEPFDPTQVRDRFHDHG